MINLVKTSTSTPLYLRHDKIVNYLNAVLQVRDYPNELLTSEIISTKEVGGWVRVETRRGIFTIPQRLLATFK